MIIDYSKIRRESLNEGYKTAADSSLNLTIAEDTVMRAEEALKNAQRFLDTEGQEALERALEKATEYGQQSNLVSEMATQARRLADEHEEEAQKIEKIGLAAVNTSEAAYDLARNSYDQQRNSSIQSGTLQQTVLRLEEEIKNAEGKSQRSLQVAKEAYNNALNLYKDAHSLNLPKIDLQAIKDQAKQAKADAEDLKESLRLLLDEREQLLLEAEEESKEAKELLDDAYKHQQMADELLADLDKAKASADDARNQSENTFKEAQKIYDTLQGMKWIHLLQ